MISVCHKGVTLLLVCGLCLLPTGVLADTQYLTDDEGVPVGDTIIVPEPDFTWEEATKTVAEVTAVVVVVTFLIVWAEPLLCGTRPAPIETGVKTILEKPVPDPISFDTRRLENPILPPEGMQNVPETQQGPKINPPRGTVNNPATIRNTGGINPGAMEEYPHGGGQMINRGGGGTATVLENPQQIQIWTPNEILARQAIDDILAVNPRGLDGAIRIVHHAPPEIAAALPIPAPNLGVTTEVFVPIENREYRIPAIPTTNETARIWAAMRTHDWGFGGTYAALLNVTAGPPLQRTMRLVPGAGFREPAPYDRHTVTVQEIPIPPAVEVIVDNTTLRI